MNPFRLFVLLFPPVVVMCAAEGQVVISGFGIGTFIGAQTRVATLTVMQVAALIARVAAFSAIVAVKPARLMDQQLISQIHVVFLMSSAIAVRTRVKDRKLRSNLAFVGLVARNVIFALAQIFSGTSLSAIWAFAIR